MAASIALAGAGCSGPPHATIVPYVRMPEMMVPGRPLFFASAFVRRGRAQGVLVECNMGRPTKIEGNPLHPSSLGATDPFAQASVLQLWDPDRSQAVYRGNVLSTWEAFESALAERRGAWRRNGGEGLRILTGTVSSPTLASQLADLLERYPNARVHCHDPLHDDAGIDAARLAFGAPADVLLRLNQADIVVAFDADIFGDWPGAVRYARDFMSRRHDGAGGVAGNRQYAVETQLTLTGARADNRLALPPHQLETFVWRHAARLGVPDVSAGSAVSASDMQRQGQWDEALADALTAHRGRAVVVGGGCLSAQTRALVHAIDERLGNAGKTVVAIAPVESPAVNHAESIAALASDMQAGRVDTLLTLDANPAYDAPADLEFAQALSRVPFSVHLGLYRDETGRRSIWHLPQSHSLEHWSDARAHDGTASIVQPVIAPLYRGRSQHELIALVSDDVLRSGHAIVQRYWKRQINAAAFDAFWQESLRSGVVAGTPRRR